LSVKSLIRKVGTVINIERATSTSDGMGGYTKSWSVVFSRIPCMFQEIKGSEIERDNKNTVLADHKVFIDAEYAGKILESDRVTYNDNGTTKYYRIHWIKNPVRMNHYLRLDLLEMKT